MIRLSIIVPIFNEEQYIELCLRSLYNQDLSTDDFEVICVDDCSTDGSIEVVKQLQKEYSNLQLICHVRNKCAGGARNTGLKVAQGRYIWFVDSDDCITSNCLEILLHDAELFDVDVLQFDFQYLQDGILVPAQNPYNDDRIYSGYDFLEDESHTRWYHRIPVPWNKLYKRSFLIENQLWYSESVMYEDTDLSLFIFTLAKRVKHFNMAPYCYRDNMSSICRKKRTARTLVYAIMQQNRCLRAYSSSPTCTYKNIIQQYIYNQLIQLRFEIKDLDFVEKIKYYNLIKSIDIDGLKLFCNWRTWLTIRYGITCFVRK